MLLVWLGKVWLIDSKLSCSLKNRQRIFTSKEQIKQQNVMIENHIDHRCKETREWASETHTYLCFQRCCFQTVWRKPYWPSAEGETLQIHNNTVLLHKHLCNMQENILQLFKNGVLSHSPNVVNFKCRALIAHRNWAEHHLPKHVHIWSRSGILNIQNKSNVTF